MDDLTLLAATAGPWVGRRQSAGSSGDVTVTPDIVAQLDLNDKRSRRNWILAVNNVAIILIVTFVTARLIVRRVMTRQFFLDDTLVAVASVFTLGLCAVTLLALNYGYGEHIWNINPSTVLEDVKKCVQLMFIGNVFYSCAITFTKLSIIVSYLRIFPYNSLRITMYTVAGVTIGLFIASVPATVFQCHPVSAAWEFGDTEAKCYKFMHFLYASTAINVTTDLVLCVAPLPYFWKLQLPKKQKIIVSFLFFIGGFAGVANIVRIAFLRLLEKSIDVTWYLGPSVLWTIAECTIGICCVSIPTLRPLFGRLLPSVFHAYRTPYDRTGPTAQRAAYAMGSWSGTTPARTVEENKISESDLGHDEQIPTSWLEDDNDGRVSGSVTPGPEAMVRPRDEEDVVDEARRTKRGT